MSGIIIIVRFEKQKCLLLKDIYVKKKTFIELEREGGRRCRFAESRIRFGNFKERGFLKLTGIVIARTVTNGN